MDPYLEDTDIWPDFHTMYLAALRTIVRRRLPRKYRLVLERHAWVEEPDDTGWRQKRPDIYIKSQTDASMSDGTVMSIADRAPLSVLVPETHADGPAFLRVIDRNSRRVVTVIELLSPSNKQRGADHDLFLAKRTELLGRRINLVEIDFLRRGERMPVDQMPENADYCILVSQAIEHPRAGLWAFSVREAIPNPIPIPLLPEDRAVEVSLREALDRAYDDADFGGEIDYSSPPTFPLEGEDATWAAQMLQSRSLDV
jgi:hypothetical protein